jgi:hypothetical protein
MTLIGGIRLNFEGEPRVEYGVEDTAEMERSCFCDACGILTVAGLHGSRSSQ